MSGTFDDFVIYADVEFSGRSSGTGPTMNALDDVPQSAGEQT
jgi:hypothetical protein